MLCLGDCDYSGSFEVADQSYTMCELQCIVVCHNNVAVLISGLCYCDILAATNQSVCECVFVCNLGHIEFLVATENSWKQGETSSPQIINSMSQTSQTEGKGAEEA